MSGGRPRPARPGVPVVELRQLSRRFGGITALSDLSIVLGEGTAVGVIGPNGAGKSTLINLVAGTLPPSRGRVIVAGLDLTSASPYRMARAGVARTYQVPRPLRGLTVTENVSVAATFCWLGAAGRRESRYQAEQVLDRVGLWDQRLESPDDLSDVELRTLDLARALVARPRLLLLDEMMAGRGAEGLSGGIELLRALRADGTALIMVEHVVRAVLEVSDLVVVLDAGRELLRGPPEEIVGDERVIRSYLERPPRAGR
jgi:branched-chain amino acid transport system ATP-binding protein